ncbi:uncharacterized protein LOC119569656 [Penaeus monodon]|uniref:uncharacterized protein LOC119569656 n=1 Tax=Penaeus monodon TaxID=6687 RepID=UPI0018A76474|nr:uncharacterized protein LOC119569656 [Penaeus monodon]
MYLWVAYGLYLLGSFHQVEPVSDPEIHRPNSVDQRGLPPHERGRPKKLIQHLRIGTSNVGSMKGTGRVLADSMKTRKVGVLCVQGTRWKGNKCVCRRHKGGKKNSLGRHYKKNWKKVDESERCITGGDMNGHVGSSNDAIGRIHGGNAYGNGDEDGEKIKNCKVIPGDHVTEQHHLVAIDLTKAVSQKKKRKTITQGRMKWFKLKESDSNKSSKTEF